MRFKSFIIILLTLLTAPSLLAQTDHAWIGTGKVRARITPTGIHRNAEGGFLLESEIPGQPAKNLLSHLTPWVGGWDPGDNLKLACEMDNPLVSDWQAGFRGIPNSGKVWKVTAEQIAAHRLDYQDNGVIDNPIPEIFAWPGRGNSFSEGFNNFSTDSIHHSIGAPYRELDWDGVYSPQDGEYPFVQAGIDLPFKPQTLVFSPFFDSGENDLTHGRHTDLNCFVIAFTLECQQLDFLENAIFIEYGGFFNSGHDRLDTLFLGVYADFDIGNPNDDYLGCTSDPYREMIFSYNSDTLHDNIIGSNPPAISINCLNYFIDAIDYTQPLSHFIPIYPNNFPAGTRLPTTPNEYFNYITGTWRDGTPLTAGGIGYNLGMGSSPINMAFPDNPTEPNGWSELNEGNPAGNRKAIFAYGPTTIKPHGHRNNIRFILTASDKVGLSQQIMHLTEMKDLQKYIDYGFGGNNPLDALCFSPLSINEIVPNHSLYPNPAHDYCSLRTNENEIVKISIFNALGQTFPVERLQSENEHDVLVSLKNLPTGVYFFQWFSKDGRRGCEKVVKN